MSISIGVNSKPGESVGTRNSAGCNVPSRASAVRPTTSTASAWSTPEMNVLRPLRIQSRSVAAGGRRDPVRVRPGVRLGDREGDDRLAAGDARQPSLALLVGAEAGEDRADDRRRDDHHQQPGAAGVELLGDDRQLVHPGTPPPYSTGQVDAEKAELAGLVPQLGHRLVRRRLGPGVLPAVLRRQLGDDRRSSCCSSVSVKSIATPRFPVRRRRARRRRRPAGRRCTGSSVTTPVGRGVDLVLHLHRLQPQQRLAALDPIADGDDDADDGAGHRRQQRAGGDVSAGSANRSTRRRVTAPSGEST